MSTKLKTVSTTRKKPSVKKQKYIDELVINHRENGRKLARSFLRRWRVRMPLEEVDSIVDLTLCEAAGRYDKTKGASFMTFFYYHLRGQMVRAVEGAAQQSSMMVNFSQTSDLDVTEWAQQDYALNSMVISESICPEGSGASTPEHAAIRKQSIEKCVRACDQLDDLEKEIISRSYSKDEALVDIAKSLGYSRCHISRVKKRAMVRLREILEVQGLEGTGAPLTLSETVSAERTPRKRRSRVRSNRVSKTKKPAAIKRVA